MTRPYAEVIGDPIAQSKSPLIHNFWLAKLGIDAEYRACHVRSEELVDYLHRRNLDDEWRGCNVTMPHKLAVMPIIDRLAPEAERIGAVNTIVMRDFYLEGHNTDAAGFMEPLRPFIAEQTYRFASLVGAGGSAKAIADALYEADFTLLSFARDPAKADGAIGKYIWDKDLLLPLDDLNRATKGIVSGSDRIDIFVNTSPLGMTGHPPLDVDLTCVVTDTIVYDIVTHPLETALLRQARSLGLRTVDGLAMLVGQAAVAFEKFFCAPAPREHDAELRELLIA